LPLVHTILLSGVSLIPNLQRDFAFDQAAVYAWVAASAPIT
jgi:hypothetical protein